MVNTLKVMFIELSKRMVGDLKRLITLLTIVSFILVIVGCGMANEKSLKSEVPINDQDYSKIVASNNSFAFDLLSLLSEEQENAFISPASIFLALSMAYNGADGITKDEIAKVLHIEDLSTTQLNQFNASLMEKIDVQSSNDIQINIGNSIWINENFHFKDGFVQNTTKYYQAEIDEVDMLDEKSLKKMNKWVKKSTKGNIKEIINEPLSPDTVAIILNAIYFNGDWKHAFNTSKTKDSTFYLMDGTTKTISYMELNETIAYLENDYFQIASLSYSNEKMSMNIVLPKEDISLQQIEDMFTVENWMQWKGSLSKKEGTIVLPKFQIEYEMALKEGLQQLGMTTAFEETANFKKMVKEEVPIYISQVMHKTYIDVNEKGTEASAATSVEMETTSAPIDNPFLMDVNRPFFTIITDDDTGAILFIGNISNPK